MVMMALCVFSYEHQWTLASVVDLFSSIYCYYRTGSVLRDVSVYRLIYTRFCVIQRSGLCKRTRNSHCRRRRSKTDTEYTAVSVAQCISFSHTFLECIKRVRCRRLAFPTWPSATTLLHQQCTLDYLTRHRSTAVDKTGHHHHFTSTWSSTIKHAWALASNSTCCTHQRCSLMSVSSQPSMYLATVHWEHHRTHQRHSIAVGSTLKSASIWHPAFSSKVSTCVPWSTKRRAAVAKRKNKNIAMSSFDGEGPQRQKRQQQQLSAKSACQKRIPWDELPVSLFSP